MIAFTCGIVLGSAFGAFIMGLLLGREREDPMDWERRWCDAPAKKMTRPGTEAAVVLH